MGLLIAGARATGTTASWMMTFLGCHQEWRAKAVAEVESLLANNPFTSLSSPSESLSSRLATIPLEIWESETPVLDAIIKETTRVDATLDLRYTSMANSFQLGLMLFTLLVTSTLIQRSMSIPGLSTLAGQTLKGHPLHT